MGKMPESEFHNNYESNSGARAASIEWYRMHICEHRHCYRERASQIDAGCNFPNKETQEVFITTSSTNLDEVKSDPLNEEGTHEEVFKKPPRYNFKW